MRVAVALMVLATADAFADGAKLVRVLKEGQIAFGAFVREKTEAEARELAANDGLDFVFYDLWSAASSTSPR